MYVRESLITRHALTGQGCVTEERHRVKIEHGKNPIIAETGMVGVEVQDLRRHEGWPECAACAISFRPNSD